MLRLLVFFHKLFKSRKPNTDEPVPDKTITVGKTLLSGITIAWVVTIFYLIAKGADLLAAGMTLVLFAGYWFFGVIGGKFTVRVDKELKAEPEQTGYAEEIDMEEDVEEKDA